MEDTAKIVALVILAILLITFGPLLTIWALNTLFPVLAIPYTLSTWFAALLIFSGPIRSATK